MSGRALIIVVTGIIIITSVILYNISAASTKITANFNNYFLRQSAQNIAHSGANLCLRQVGNTRTYRTNGWAVDMLGGRAFMTIQDTNYGGYINAIVIRSVGTMQRNTTLERRDTTVAYCYFPPPAMPGPILGALTLNASNQVNGNITIDGRDHDISGNVVADSGTYGIWTTGASFSAGGSGSIGGTSGLIDYAPPGSGVADPSVVKLNGTYSPSFPTTPDETLGGAANGFPEGKLVSIAKSGVNGSQYVTNPSKLKSPLSGVTYVDLPSGGSWSPANIKGSGILVVHNSALNALIKNATGTFSGLVVADDMIQLHGNVLGGIVTLTTTPGGNVVGNGNGSIRYSKMAIENAVANYSNGTPPRVIAWWE